MCAVTSRNSTLLPLGGHLKRLFHSGSAATDTNSGAQLYSHFFFCFTVVYPHRRYEVQAQRGRLELLWKNTVSYRHPPGAFQHHWTACVCVCVCVWSSGRINSHRKQAVVDGCPNVLCSASFKWYLIMLLALTSKLGPENRVSALTPVSFFFFFLVRTPKRAKSNKQNYGRLINSPHKRPVFQEVPIRLCGFVLQTLG